MAPRFNLISSTSTLVVGLGSLFQLDLLDLDIGHLGLGSSLQLDLFGLNIGFLGLDSLLQFDLLGLDIGRLGVGRLGLGLFLSLSCLESTSTLQHIGFL